MTPLASAPSAHADLEDFFLQPIAEAVVMLDPSLAGDLDAANPLASLETMFAHLDQSLGWMTGVPGSAAAAGSFTTDPVTHALTSATVPLETQGITEPVANISVGGGSMVPVLVDTGSAGLVLPIWDIGWQNIGFPTDFGMGSYAGGMGYFYATLPTTVSFGEVDGQDIVASTSVNALLFAFPTNLSCLLSGCWDINSFLSSTGANADGILGIGPNAIGPTPDSIPTADLPGALGHGVLLDQTNHTMTFGDNPLTGGTEVNGSPNATLGVQITPPGGVAGDITKVPVIIDSGGVYGTLPASIATAAGIPGTSGVLPPGTEISFTSASGQPLYSYTVDSTNSPSLFSGTGAMNTGNVPFAQQPIYTSYSPVGHGTTIFGGPPAIEP
ncbi:MAG: PecA family PE domain-processing aspartic protease [Mycobacterium sp.]